MKLIDRVRAKALSIWPTLFQPVDIASLVFFRVSFGLLLVVEVWRYFEYGWIRKFYIEPQFHFTYYGFGWVQPWPGSGMYVLFSILGLSALCVMLGLLYRLASVLFFLSFTYVFLLDQARYLNHFYLISVISFLMMFVPAHRSFSLDVLLNKNLRAKTAPRWALWILRAQLGLMYVFAGLAKINADWLRGSPMREMLARNVSLPLVGKYFTDERVVMLFAYGGLLLDLFVVPFLLWRKTRYFALAATVGFHVMNHFLFNIGIFPFFAIAGTLLFLAPDWPRRLFGRRTRIESEKPAGPPKKIRKVEQPYSRAAVILLAVHFGLQLLLPLRHHLYPGDVNWTDEGQRFAWRMMLRAKQANGRFVATDRFTGQRRMIYPAQYLHREQVATMWIQPDMILQFAHFAAEDVRRREGWHGVAINAAVTARLNGRRGQAFVDPQVNLAAEKRSLAPAKWILPLTEPLPVPH
mgnify:CR=1 FL=1